MRRRELLATGAVIAIAGCSSEEASDDPDPEDEDETKDLETSNESENESDGPEPDTRNETDTDNPVDEQTDDEEKEPEDDPGPTDEELAQEHIDAAQDAFASAIDQVNDQGDGGLEALDTTYPSLGTSQAEGALEDAHAELEATVEYDVSKEQDTVIADLQMAIDTLELVFGYQPRVYDAYSAATDLLDNVENRNLDAVEENAPGVASTATDLRENLKSNANVRPTPTVDAIGGSALISVIETYVMDLSAIESIGTGAQPLVEAERDFWIALELYENGENRRDEFQSAEESYNAVVSALERVEDTAHLADRSETVVSYSASLAEAADAFDAATASRMIGDTDDAAEYEKEGNDAIDEADSAGLYDTDSLR
ncbi:hypothetical protein [Natrinema salaciae]|uniref:Uncharacterized protein n=1 Tax=Natrinema salaciae TaxID=1186196 RepID=A0A1H9EYP3_9EURY|nr:hypothetical protein [Natrinema salaciae]SEQ30343.1 hypothetical protein SAMN04489841_1410 [Natrinema salaciae]